LVNNVPYIPYEDKGEVLACLGYWNWDKVMRITVQSLSLKIHLLAWLVRAAGLFLPMPKPIKPGAVLKQIVLTPIGFQHPAQFSALLRHLNNQLLAEDIEQIFCICEKGHGLLKGMKGFIRVGTNNNLFVKALQGNDLAPDKPVYIDGIDL